MNIRQQSRYWPLLLIFAIVLLVIGASAQSKQPLQQPKPQKNVEQKSARDRNVRVVDSIGRVHNRMRKFTVDELRAAAQRTRAKKAKGATKRMSIAGGVVAAADNVPPVPGTLTAPNGQLIPDYFGTTPNYANSPQPKFLNEIRTPENWIPGTGLRKFVDSLALLNTPNTLGNMLPIAVPDTEKFPGADYYEIELVEYEQKLHSDLPPTRLRGYRQTNIDNPSADNFPPAQYLGPIIVAKKDRPVRIRFKNNLPTGTGGDLFIPVDVSVMGSGPGPNVSDTEREARPADVICSDPETKSKCYTQNRGTIHLHGGVTPWISDGTTHQWVTPATESTPYPMGVSARGVPDMNGGNLAPGEYTFYYTNQQSARLMFYHDHAAGITRLNVYAGEAAGYLLQDDIEKELVEGGLIPGDQIPLIIQDKTFVDATTIGQEDPTWNWGTGAIDPTTGRRLYKTGDLWWPHVYMTAQNPFDLSGANGMGRWAYGPWFWPPTVDIKYPPVPNPYYDMDCETGAGPCDNPEQPPEIPGTPNPSWGAEAFLDTPVINGTVYPYVEVDPKAYRLRVLNAAHDRFWNLQLYVADTNLPKGCATCAIETEVKMVPATAEGIAGKPIPAGATWPTDQREGGVPDPSTAGPSWIYIGTEGGFLPMPVVVPQQPVTWNNDVTTFNAGNVQDHSLLLGPAERADVIVDFSKFAGKTLILYNDAPAPFPALDPHYDYYTGSPDLREIGGVNTVMPGFGPNTRTLMKIIVRNTEAADEYLIGPLNAKFAHQAGAPGVFERGQDPIIVGQPAPQYEAAYGVNFPKRFPSATNPSAPGPGYVRIQDTKMNFKTYDGATVSGFDIEPKAIQDEMGETFDDYGRMSAKLGLELRNTTAATQTFVMQGYADPPTELIKLSKMGTQIGTMEDGTQIWKVTHNGVDTHPVHFHLFHVQLLNRVGWDGAIRPPHPTELGWKDTVRISPLEDTIVALRPITPTQLPWPVPNSIRPLEPALPLGSTLGFSKQGPGAVPVSITNEYTNFGWEYVWHCHILSHEENDMMRSIVFAFPPDAPTNVAADVTGKTVNLTWETNSPLVSSFTVQRATDPGFTQINKSWTIDNPAVRTLTDSNVPGAMDPYYYRVVSTNKVGSEIAGYSTTSIDSDPSNSAEALVDPPVTLTPKTLTFNAQLVSTTSATQTVTLENKYTTDITVGAVTTTGDFAVATNNCAATLAAGATCTVDLTFTPTAAGNRTGSVVVNFTDTKARTLTSSLSGIGADKAALTQPAPGTLPGKSATFAWSTGTAVDAYKLQVGTTVGGSNVYNGAATNQTSATVSNLPMTGVTVYVRLSSQINGTWYYTDYTYTAAIPVKATMISPTNGATLAGSTDTFTWNDTGAPEYWLWIGTAPGRLDIYSSGGAGVLSRTPTNLPTNGSTVYVRLHTRILGVWQYNDYTYKAAGTPVKAAMITPTPGSDLFGTTATFNWTAGSGVTEYWLWVGTAPGKLDIHSSGGLGVLSRTVTNLPANNNTIYVRLHSRINGAWQYTDYTYVSKP